MPTSKLNTELFGLGVNTPSTLIHHQLFDDRLAELVVAMAGVKPDKPALAAKDIPLSITLPNPAKKLAFSYFLNSAKINWLAQTTADFSVTATIHVGGDPSAIIETFELVIKQQKIAAVFSHRRPNVLSWAPLLPPTLALSSVFPTSSAAALAQLGISKNQYTTTIEPLLVNSLQTGWTTKIVDQLPDFDIKVISPYVTYSTPADVKYLNEHVLVTSQECTVTLDGCPPRDITIGPDTAFPYGLASDVAASTPPIWIATYLTAGQAEMLFREQLGADAQSGASGKPGVFVWQSSTTIKILPMSINIANIRPLQADILANAQVRGEGTVTAWITDGTFEIHINEQTRRTLLNSTVGGMDAHIGTSYVTSIATCETRVTSLNVTFAKMLASGPGGFADIDGALVLADAPTIGSVGSDIDAEARPKAERDFATSRYAKGRWNFAAYYTTKTVGPIDPRALGSFQETNGGATFLVGIITRPGFTSEQSSG